MTPAMPGKVMSYASLRAWVGQDPARLAGRGDRLELSAEARLLLEGPPPSDPLKSDPMASLAPEDRVRVLILQAMLGIEIRIAPKVPSKAAADAAAEAQVQAREAGWGVDYRLHERYEESESLHVAAAGVIRTADGKEIAFSVALNMSRRYVEETNFRFRAGDAARPIDPLVINYSGAAAELTERRFRFDLQVGGLAEEIPFVREGSGFLALDRDGNGKVDNGSELFGPTTGNGFGELAGLDADGNQWIDAADPAFAKLLVWTKDATGKDRLFALGQLGIGAIYVGAVDAGFTLTGGSNQALGVNQKAGLYVRENGTAGTVQQLDLLG